MQKVLKSGFEKDHQPLRNRKVEDGRKIANETAGALFRIEEAEATACDVTCSPYGRPI